jgi:hypothetical protein
MKTRLLSILIIASMLAACSGNKSKKNDLMDMGLKGKVKSLNETSYYAMASKGNVTNAKQGEKEFPWTNSRYSFNTEGNFISHNAYNPDGSLVFQQLYKYDGKGLKTETTYYYRLGSDSLRERSVYAYDSAGNLTDLKTYDLIGYLDRRFAYKYDNSGNLAQVLNYDYDDNIDSTLYNTFDNSGNLIITIARNADSSLRYKTTSTYDDKGNVLEFKYFDMDGKLRDKLVYKYDDKGNKTEYVKYVADTLSEKQLYKYDKNGLPISNEVFKSDGSLETQLTYEYVLDKNKNWIKRTEFNFNVPKYIVERRIEYYP